MPAPIRFGRYLLLERLAVGGMAEIFLAKATGDGGFERLCVIKRVLPHLGRDPEFIRMFLDEARLAAQLHHPGIVQIHELGRVGDDYFIAMEYLAGEDLAAVIQQSRRTQRPVPVEVAVQMIAAAAGALHSAHEHRDPRGIPLRIVHRDVSPSNLFVTFHGAVKVLDFGVARAEGRLAATDTGGTKGKLSYMSPEQALGREVDRRTDVWALGLCLRELLTGERLFSGGGATLDRLRRICADPIAPPGVSRSDVPPELDRIVLRALARDPGQRPPTAEALCLELEAVLTAKPTAGRAAMADYLEELFGKAHVLARSGAAWREEAQTATPPHVTARMAPAGVAGTPPHVTARMAPAAVAGMRHTPASAPDPAATPTTTFWLAPQLAQPSAAADPATSAEEAETLQIPARAGSGPDAARPSSGSPRRFSAVWTIAAATVLAVLAMALPVRRQDAPVHRGSGTTEPRGEPHAIGRTRLSAPVEESRAPGPVGGSIGEPLPFASSAAAPLQVPAPMTEAGLHASSDGRLAADGRPPDTAATPIPVAAPKSGRSSRAARREREAAATGRLTVHANVPVEVLLDGRRLGRVPLDEVKVPAGRHVLHLLDAARGLSRKVTVRVEAGQTTVHRAELGTGTLNVDAVPWAEVSVDGVSRGLTPIAGVVLWEGEHRIQLAGPEHTRTITVRVRKGQVTAVRESLGPTAVSR